MGKRIQRNDIEHRKEITRIFCDFAFSFQSEFFNNCLNHLQDNKKYERIDNFNTKFVEYYESIKSFETLIRCAEKIVSIIKKDMASNDESLKNFCKRGKNTIEEYKRMAENV